MNLDVGRLVGLFEVVFGLNGVTPGAGNVTGESPGWK